MAFVPSMPNGVGSATDCRIGNDHAVAEKFSRFYSSTDFVGNGTPYPAKVGVPGK